MPATRSSSRQPQSAVLPYINMKKRPVATTTSHPDIIIVSSDDDEPLAKRAGPSKKSYTDKSRKTKSKKPLPVIDPDDIVELTSGDEQTPPKKPAQPADKQIVRLQKEIRKLKQSNAEYQRDLSRVSQTSAVTKKERKFIDVNKLEDSISCEVCTLKMWTPYILSECGHSFCQSCLQDWFSATFTHHMAVHPNFIQGQTIPHQARALLLHPSILFDAKLQQQVQLMLAQYQSLQPPYTCPKCRHGVYTRPVEDFKLKAIVQQMAEALGELSPRKEVCRSKGSRNEGPFDGFFPHTVIQSIR
ncbi:hypothetical protein SERLADRAFT_386462 [Serpula lacrymans var. lacrymans S7.9]|uniref:RING-type domain-containing protein n=2 Tax=Serpula lacrymans var. lacrymans TaxID=341189 RepID=F8NTW3_SERL9|nr:uncharacterized protein SERLADRAFT_386462 [Serpula lacrymans var. lacrymans S7.9]EGO25091.1 hypothetical protein SERLADRAFT_386462 [Serpula lacrymans var. lacrymans S7.9]